MHAVKHRTIHPIPTHNMILPDFFLPTRANQCWNQSGIDSLEHCVDKNHYLNFPWPIEYNYNSRGFRDSEWPETLSELQRSIWCIGDSFTVGIGSPHAHTWPVLLQQQTGIRCINVSMDGASNQWIAKKATRIISTIAPDWVVLHWSYISRREKTEEQVWQTFYNDIADPAWPRCTWQDRHQLPQWIQNEITEIHGGWPDRQVSDEARMLYATPCSDDEDIAATLDCIHSLPQNRHTQVIHSFIPEFTPTALQSKFLQSRVPSPCIAELEILDRARDGHHYDILTSRVFVEQIVQFLS